VHNFRYHVSLLSKEGFYGQSSNYEQRKLSGIEKH
jgi:hypothetical protein